MFKKFLKNEEGGVKIDPILLAIVVIALGFAVESSLKASRHESGTPATTEAAE